MPNEAAPGPARLIGLVGIRPMETGREIGRIVDCLLEATNFLLSLTPLPLAPKLLLCDCSLWGAEEEVEEELKVVVEEEEEEDEGEEE